MLALSDDSDGPWPLQYQVRKVVKDSRPGLVLRYNQQTTSRYSEFRSRSCITSAPIPCCVEYCRNIVCALFVSSFQYWYSRSSLSLSIRNNHSYTRNNHRQCCTNLALTQQRSQNQAKVGVANRSEWEKPHLHPPFFHRQQNQHGFDRLGQLIGHDQVVRQRNLNRP